MKSIAVFCGSSIGYNEVFKTRATEPGIAMAARKIDLVYGSAKVGLMGTIADAVLAAGGKITGVVPAFLQTKELAHTGLTNFILVDIMHERKTKMNKLCDGVPARRLWRYGRII